MSVTVPSWPTTLVYNDTDFRAQFPAYEDPTAFPLAALQQGFENATNFISNYNVGSLRDSQRQYALYLMMVHLMQLPGSGAAPGLQTSSKIRDVSITWQVPPVRSQWAWWLNQTPAGQTLLALLKKASSGGLYIGGSGGRIGLQGPFARRRLF